MGQNNIWMRYFTVGSLLILASGCVKNEYSQNADFYFVNKTPYQISYRIGFEKFNVPANGTIFIQQVQDGLKKLDPTSYLAPFKGIGTPTIIKFDQIKCLTIDANSEHSPLNINSYLAEKVNKRTYKFTYTFTEADYNRATTCP